jgi:hypothetical protein
MSQDSGFRTLFALLGVKPFFVTTDELSSNPRGVVGAIADDMKLPVNARGRARMERTLWPPPPEANCRIDGAFQAHGLRLIMTISKLTAVHICWANSPGTDDLLKEFSCASPGERGSSIGGENDHRKKSRDHRAARRWHFVGDGAKWSRDGRRTACSRQQSSSDREACSGISSSFPAPQSLHAGGAE